MFIFMDVPLHCCLISVPLVFGALYIIIYGSVLIKSAELIHNKKHLQCWVAEVIEPIFDSGSIEEKHKIIFDNELTDIDIYNMKKRIVGTVAVMRHSKRQDWAWLFRLAVDKRYRRKGIASRLTKAVQEWCKVNRFNNLELCITDCQEGARQLFAKAGFEVSQMYHQRLLTSAFTLQMYQLKYEVRSTFE
ncbi:hypothetical protein HHI36_015025 [Cryptolaemus montrouzieri]|uniref:N-acetyltransferase domain-containing protein n=1 Tax=Cryptolaemus montrouzieri TaxID=559131 RepID=A0ABD2N4Q7_9CUCU